MLFGEYSAYYRWHKYSVCISHPSYLLLLSYTNCLLLPKQPFHWIDHKVGWEILYLISSLIVFGGRRRCYPFWNPQVWTVSSVAEECSTRCVLSPLCILCHVLRNIAWGWKRWSRSLSVVSQTERTLCNSNSSNCLRPLEWRGKKTKKKEEGVRRGRLWW